MTDSGEKILEKAAYVQEAVAVLEEKQSVDRSEYRTNRELRAVVEREFHTAIEACSDIAGMIISRRGEEVAESYSGRFEQLVTLGICSEKVGRQMERAAGFRNILAHKYGATIDDDLVYKHLQEDVAVLRAFIVEVREAFAAE